MENNTNSFNITGLPTDTIKEIYGCMDAERLMNMCQTNSDNRDVIMKMCENVIKKVLPEIPAEIREQHTILLGAIANAIRRNLVPSRDVNTYIDCIMKKIGNGIKFNNIPHEALHSDILCIKFETPSVDIMLIRDESVHKIYSEKIQLNESLPDSENHRILSRIENIAISFIKYVLPLFREIKTYSAFGSQYFLEHIHEDIAKRIVNCSLSDFYEINFIEKLEKFSNLSCLIIKSEFFQIVPAKIISLKSVKEIAISKELLLPPEIRNMKLETISVIGTVYDNPQDAMMKKLHMFEPGEIKSIEVVDIRRVVARLV